MMIALKDNNVTEDESRDRSGMGWIEDRVRVGGGGTYTVRYIVISNITYEQCNIQLHLFLFALFL